MPLLDITPDEINEMYEFVQTALGGEDVDVDITKKELKILARKALRDYEYEIQTWQTRNQFSNALGMPSAVNGVAQNFTYRFIYDNGMIAQRISDWFSSMARVGGKVPWKKDYITLVEGQQVYDLSSASSIPYEPGSRRIHRVMWYGRPEIFSNSSASNATVNSGDFVDNSLFTFGLNGLAYNGSGLGFLGNLFDVVLISQALEMRNKVMRSEFFYNLSGDILEVTPMPGVNSLAIQPGAKVFYYYFDESANDFWGNSTNSNTIDSITQVGNGIDDLIVNPIQIQIDTLPYSKMNSMAKNWIENYSLALAKYALAAKWRRVRTIISPDSNYQIELDYASLLEEAKTMQEDLKTKLNEQLLTFLDTAKMFEDKATIMENSAKINRLSPRKLFIG